MTSMADEKKQPKPAEDDIVLLKDLTPREVVKGGGKLRFGEPSAPPGKFRHR